MTIDKEIIKKANDIRQKIKGEDVRESLASGIELVGLNAHLNKVQQKLVKDRQDSIEAQWQTVVDETTNNDYTSAPELLEARVDSEGNSFSSLKEKNDNFEERTYQAIQKQESILNKTTVANRIRKPMITIIDDDGNEKFLDTWEGILNRKSFKMDIAVVSSYVGNRHYLDWNELERLVTDYPVELVNHSYNHPFLANLSEEEIRADFEKSKKILSDRGHNGDIYVYASGSQNLKVRQIARDYFRCAFLDRGGLNPAPLKTFSIRRVAMYDNNDMMSLEELKAQVDSAIANNEWLVYMTHSQFGGMNIARIEALIDYVNSKSDEISWAHASEGISKLGNVIDVGDSERDYSPSSESYYIVDCDGITHSNRERPVNHLGTSIDFNTPLTDYPLNKYSVGFILNSSPTASLFPENTGGLVETHYEGSGNFSYQRFKPYGSNKLYQRTWNVVNKVWGKFERIGEDIALQSSVTNDTPPSAFEYGKEYVSTITTANATGLPTGSGGILKTYRYGAGFAYTYQTYKPVYTSKLYVRGAKDTGASWDSWSS